MLRAVVRPVPVRGTLCGLPGALSANERLALRAPDPAGVNVTLTVQLAETPNVVPQVFDETTKSEALVPVTVILEIVSVAVPLLVSVVVNGAEVVLTV
jgi:hypothetical protein